MRRILETLSLRITRVYWFCLQSSRKGLLQAITKAECCQLQEKHDAMLEAMEEAKEHIHMQFYIYRDDEIGEQFQDVMIRKARQGVKVRLLCDGLGSHRLSRRFIRTLRNAGVEFHFFTSD